ncbi:MAG TPA: D-alanyl-D-alanine carboxypeptidase family protein [Clostridia bacterium]|nr:D-alanyl-D-alanine carboxypeptidase family protein [Clostridia bacterium]
MIRNISSLKPFIAIVAFLITVLGVQQSPCFAFDLSCKGAVLINGRTGQVLYDTECEAKLYPASTTKILTAMIVLNKARLDEVVTVGEGVEGIDGTSIWLVEGEQLTVEELLYAMLLNSANDAALVLAQHVGGSEQGFAQMMNSTAQKCGAVNSNFVNPHGLPDEDHYTTAYDLSMIAKEAMKNPKFRKIVATSTKNISRKDPEAQRELYNRNRLLNGYEGSNGIKTGYTNAAGQCLVASAKRDGRELIAVVLGDEGNGVWSDAQKLLDYGFDNFKPMQVIQNGSLITPDVPVINGASDASAIALQSLSIDVPKGSNPDIRRELLLKEVEAPVKKGQQLGVVVVANGQREVGRIDLIAAHEVGGESAAGPWLWFAGAVLLAVVALREYSRRRRIERFIQRQRFLRRHYQ